MRSVNQNLARFVLLITAISEPMTADSPLPIELKDRVNCWILRFAQLPTGLEEFYQLKKHATSLNALIRQEIRKGNI